MISLSMFVCFLTLSFLMALSAWNGYRFGFQAFKSLDEYITLNPKCDNETWKNTSSRVLRFSKYRCDDLYCNEIYSDYVKNTFDDRCDATRKSAGIVWDRDKIVNVLSCVEISMEFNFLVTIANFDDCYSIDNTDVFFNYLWPTFYFFGFCSCALFCCSLGFLGSFSYTTRKRHAKQLESENDLRVMPCVKIGSNV